MGLKNTCQGVRCTLPRVTTGIRNIAPNQSRLIRLSEPSNKKIRAVRWKNRTALICKGFLSYLSLIRCRIASMG